MKLGKRLSMLDKAIKKRYSIIWDCCCDHGFLGMALLKRRAAKGVYFVDVLKQPMQQLSLILQQRFSQAESRWKVFCRDLKLIEVPDKEQQLFIIAGVGGDKTRGFIQSIHEKSKHLKIDFLICSVHGNYLVRELLIDLGFKLLDEVIIKENKRFYELIYVSFSGEREISKTGELMWDLEDAEHLEYLNKTINHFEKKAKVSPECYQGILDDYKKLGGSKFS